MTGHLTPTTGPLRVCRGVVLAVASTVLTIAAHGMAGGGLPSTVPTVLLSVGVSGTGMALATRRYSLGAVLGVLGVTALITHLLLSVESNDMSGMNPATSNGLTMLGAHAAAVLTTALLLVWADTLLFALAKAVRRLLPTLVTPAPITTRPRCPRPTTAPRGPFTTVSLCRSNARRGPPVAA